MGGDGFDVYRGEAGGFEVFDGATEIGDFGGFEDVAIVEGGGDVAEDFVGFDGT